MRFDPFTKVHTGRVSAIESNNVYRLPIIGLVLRSRNQGVTVAVVEVVGAVAGVGLPIVTSGKPTSTIACRTSFLTIITVPLCGSRTIIPSVNSMRNSSGRDCNGLDGFIMSIPIGFCCASLKMS